MKKSIILTILAMALVALCIGGCQPLPPAQNETTEPNITVDDPALVTGELIDRRGQTTNITEFDSLVTRFSQVESYKYAIKDTAVDDESHQFYVKRRFVRRVLNNPEYHPSGEIYDEIFMDRVTKQAFTHCGVELCPKPDTDKEVERVEYADYYMNDPLEHITLITDTTYLGEKIVGDQYTKVFRGKYLGLPTRVWVQEYYGFPVRIEIGEGDDKRIIKFEDMMVDATRNADVDLPFNFTIKGSGKHYWNWESLLGLKQGSSPVKTERKIVPFVA